MSNDSKRIVLLILCVILWFTAINYLGPKLGLFGKPNPQQPPPVAAQPDVPPAEPAKVEPAKVEVAKAPAPAAPPQVALAKPEDLWLGGPTGEAEYHLSVQLTQAGGSVESIELAKHEAERERKKVARKPLKIVKADPGDIPAFAIESVTVRDPKAPPESEGRRFLLDTARWEAVRDAKGAVVHPILDPKTGKEIGREAAFRISFDDPEITLTRTFRLRKGADGLEMALAFDSPKADRLVSYEIEGPRGVPIEGEWYTSLFRDVFIGLAKGEKTDVTTLAASDVVAAPAKDPKTFGKEIPVRYAGVENQYFAVFIEPDPTPIADKDRIDDLTFAKVVALNAKEKPKSDVTVVMNSREFKVGPGKPAEQDFKVFAGPKVDEVLAAYSARDLAVYRKTGWFFIPGATFMAQSVIAPLLVKIYGLTEAVASVFGGKRGNYGIAIILLTIFVRLCLFPLSRKQAISAKRMQDLQPKMAEIKEKYKDDKERVTKETFALYKQYKVNPFGGCLLGLIQLPIFVGLWQALNNSVALRHAPFLWIDNLAAPDMLFKFPFDVPLLGPYFNLLPLAVVGLMLVQMHLFTPPATTPDQEMSHKIMKFMMVFMSFMFYKVPSGLGIYFITSSTWAICERLLLPKVVKATPPDEEKGDADGDRSPARTKPGGGNGNGNGNPGPKPGSFRDRLRQIVEEAQKDRTHRNDDKDRDWGRGGKPRPKPPGRKR